jgi:threonine/homoserine/homoserine lactone efflux protein
MIDNLLLRGLILGLSIAAPVGPIGVLCIRRTLSDGQIMGLVSGLGAATADAVYGTIAGFGLTVMTGLLVQQQTWLQLLGGMFLLYLGIKTLLSKPAGIDIEERKRNWIGAYTSAFVLTLTNPMTILSFAAVFASADIGRTAGDYQNALILISGVFVGSTLWWLLLSGGVGMLREKLNSGHLLWVNRISGVVITFFGAGSLASLVK